VPASRGRWRACSSRGRSSCPSDAAATRKSGRC